LHKAQAQKEVVVEEEEEEEARGCRVQAAEKKSGCEFGCAGRRRGA
jgi:hypothetical protein